MTQLDVASLLSYNVVLGACATPRGPTRLVQGLDARSSPFSSGPAWPRGMHVQAQQVKFERWTLGHELDDHDDQGKTMPPYSSHPSVG